MARSLEVSIPGALASRSDLLVCRLSGAVNRLAAEAVAPLGVNPGHHSVLRMLVDVGPCSQQALADGLRIDRSTMVGLVDDLEQLGCVERRRNPVDRRAYLLQTTADGRGLLEQAEQRARAALDEMFAVLSAAQREEFTSTLLLLLEGGNLPGFHRTAGAP